MSRINASHILFVSKAALAGFAFALLYLVFAQGWLTSSRVQIVQAPGLVASSAASADESIRFSYASAVQAAAPSVVNIYTTTQSSLSSGFDTPLFKELFQGGSGFAPGQSTRSGAGAGVIVGSRGHIVTNHHLIVDTDVINVMLRDGTSYPAHVIGTDPETDLAVIRVAATQLPAITMAVPDTLQVGDVVLAIGNPLGAGQTVTMGIVSATGRNSVGLHTFEDFIQTDAAINPGNSGGALINARGELVGINSAIFTQADGASAGLGLAAPVAQVRAVVEQIIQHGRVIRGWLGVVARDPSDHLRRELGLPTRGVLVTGVIEGGPAALAGIRSGDVITAIDGQTIADSRSLLTFTTMVAPGQRVMVEGVRERETFTADATLIQRPLPPGTR